MDNSQAGAMDVSESMSASGDGPTISHEPPRLVLNRCLGSTATFEYLGEEGQTPNKVYKFKTVIRNQEFIGQARNKKMAQQDAAEQALLAVFNTKCVAAAANNQPISAGNGKRKANGQSFPAFGGGLMPGVQVKTSLMRLNELRKELQWSHTETENNRKKEYTFTVVVDGQAYQGEGSSKQVAKQNAAFAAMKVVDPNFVEGQPIHKKSKGGATTGPKQNKNVQHIGGGITVTGDHPRMVLNQQVGGSVNVEIVDTKGLSLDTKITVKIVVQEQEFFGQAASKKVATQQACENALWALYGIQYNPAMSRPQPQQKGFKTPFVSGGDLHMG